MSQKTMTMCQEQSLNNAKRQAFKERELIKYTTQRQYTDIASILFILILNGSDYSV
jgi:hypothetical protein